MSTRRKILQLRMAAVVNAAPPPTQEVAITGLPRRISPGHARSANPSSTSAVAVAADEVARVEFENGLVLWMRADDLLRERGRKQVSRSGGVDTEVWEIDTGPRLPLMAEANPRSAERGALGLGIKVLEFFGVDLKKKSAAVLGKKFEERQLKVNPGLYRCAITPGNAQDPGPVLVPVQNKTLSGDKPLLIFLHGTMSSVKGSFGALWSGAKDDSGQAAASARAALEARYGEHIYAFEHRTLTESPIQNALDLVKQLPEGAQLHLVSHSRGGLVGELLCLAERNRSIDSKGDPLQPELLGQLFATDRTVAEQIGLGPLDGAKAKARNQAYAEDRARLQELLRLMDERRIKVRRFVRVACPARGTTLASGRLDRWLSVINLLTGNGIAGDVADFLLAVVKERTDPRTLPGLEAMMPGSAVTRLLHHPDLMTSADLSVIAGDIEGQGLWAQLKLLAVDWFYSGDHDLVVNTGSMVGGIRRPDGGARFLRDQGEQVTHFNYFANKKSVAWLIQGLTREESQDGGFMPINQARQEEPRWRSAVRASRTATSVVPRPIVVMVPGTMGSAIEVKGKRVWLSYWSLLRGGLENIGWGASDVAPVDLLDDFYGPLLEHLARTHRVEIFPYDWRQSVRDAASHLAEKIESLLPEAERTGQPIQIVAHSMGGLVSRAMIADGGPGTRAWRRMTAHADSRLLMLGTPNLGSHEAVRWLTGGNPTEAKLALLDFTRGVHGIIDIVARFPGMLELLPFDERSRFDQIQLWKQLKVQLDAGWPLAEATALRAAGATWTMLRNAAPDPARMLYVAGCQPATITDYRISDDEDRFPRKKLEFIATTEGDGTVTWASGRLAGVPAYYAPDTAHDALCSNDEDKRIFRGYVELLTTGKTDQLSMSPPVRSSRSAIHAVDAGPGLFVLPALPVTDDLPDEDAVRAFGFGASFGNRFGIGQTHHVVSTQTLSTPIEVRIRHGDLAYARYPVLVGHYMGDTIVSAEQALDKRLQGALSRRRDLGLYPGPLGTHAVFFNENADSKPGGAVVVGLGQVGELSPGRLEASVRDAMLDYALQLAQRPDPDTNSSSTGPRRARLSCLLIGTGASVFHLRDSIEALLRGTLSANRKLEETKLDQKVLIDRLDILEIYEDVAINAAKELAAILDAGPLGNAICWPRRCIDDGEGRRLRRNFDSDAAWWQRLEIIEERRADRLRFIATTDRARAEETLAAGQLRLADAFIAQACASASTNADVAKTLFEMLLPNRLKESAPDQRDMVLLLDEASARFPWELLEDRYSQNSGQNARPPAVASGLVRQLKTLEFRLRPAHAFENSAYVVGNPDLGGWQSFADLPGARREAERVGHLFNEQGYVTVATIDEKADAILSGLHAKPWRVLHLAGHGEHEFELIDDASAENVSVAADDGMTAAVPLRKRVSGMVIGNNTFLTPGDVEQMRHVPELVFINCCHLGQTQTHQANFNRLAANLGVQFIRMGVKAVVAAGWAVDDAAALTFAETFYRHLFDGEAFGEAVRKAREATWTNHPDANTWGAYQCYGDPAYRLQRTIRNETRTDAPSFFSPSELVAELRNLCEETRMNSKEVDDEAFLVERLRSRIQYQLQRIPKGSNDDPERVEWLERADVAAALGLLYGEGRQFGEAVEWLNKALSSDKGECPIRAVEQCANFQVRLAAQEWAHFLRGALNRNSKAGLNADLQMQQAALIARIESAIHELDLLNQRASTTERLTLLGSACKRLAWVQSETPLRVEALLNMAQYYRLAWDDSDQTDCYAFNNWAISCLLLAVIDPVYQQGDWREPLLELCLRQGQITCQKNEDEPSLWHATGLADLELVQLLLAADREERCKEHGGRAAMLYGAAFQRGASLREIASIQENVDFLIEMTADWPVHVGRVLKEIRRSL